MVDVVVVEGFSWEFPSGAFGRAWASTVASGRVGSLENLGDGAAEADSEPLRGKSPPAR